MMGRGWVGCRVGGRGEQCWEGGLTLGLRTVKLRLGEARKEALKTRERCVRSA